MAKITKEEFERNSPHYCNCPDKEIIEWQERFGDVGIPKYKAGHNGKGKPSWIKGKHHTEETRKKMSKSQSNRKRKPHSKETKDKISSSNKISVKQYYENNPKSRQACSKRTKERYKDIKYVEKMKPIWEYLKTINTNRIVSTETKKKLSDINTGKHLTEETKEKLRQYTREKSSNWKGGISKLPYCEKWTEELREDVRNRDGHICQLCNLDENSRKHPVHHIHYLKEDCYPDLITLCSSCNTKVNFNRDYYEKLFMNMLNDRELLFWTRQRLLPT